MIRGLILAALMAMGLASPVLAKPLVAILADPSGTETTDLTAPFAILSESGAVDVKIVAPTAGLARLMPGVAWVRPHETQATFDRRYPAGPDMIIVPFIMDTKNQARATWLRAQAMRGVRIVSICDGALVLAEAGLLDGRQATGHWASHGKRLKRYPLVTWRQDARWVTDGRVTTSAGVSASAPAALALLAELAGEETMLATARRLGLPAPNRTHDATAYSLSGEALGTVAGNVAAFWRHDRVAVKLADGFDALAFGAALDGWTRTYRAKAWAVAPGGATSRGGLTIYGAERPPSFTRTVTLTSHQPIEAMLDAVGEAYGEPTERFVALQLEHPRWLRRR